jgi:Membrane dipeptidase (Peptidase family M19)
MWSSSAGLAVPLCVCGKVRVIADLGIRVVQLTYNIRNMSGDGALEPANGGISNFGRDMIARIEKERLLLGLQLTDAISLAGGRPQQAGLESSEARENSWSQPIATVWCVLGRLILSEGWNLFVIRREILYTPETAVGPVR